MAMAMGGGSYPLPHAALVAGAGLPHGPHPFYPMPVQQLPPPNFSALPSVVAGSGYMLAPALASGGSGGAGGGLSLLSRVGSNSGSGAGAHEVCARTHAWVLVHMDVLAKPSCEACLPCRQPIACGVEQITCEVEQINCGVAASCLFSCVFGHAASLADCCAIQPTHE